MIQEVWQACAMLKHKVDVDAVAEVCAIALATTWAGEGIWVHGDVSTGNLLVREGKLCAMIDCGMLGVGDPACDLASAWTLFKEKAGRFFVQCSHLTKVLGPAVAPGRYGKVLIVAAGLKGTNVVAFVQSWRVINEVIADYKRKLY